MMATAPQLEVGLVGGSQSQGQQDQGVQATSDANMDMSSQQQEGSSFPTQDSLQMLQVSYCLILDVYIILKEVW